MADQPLFDPNKGSFQNPFTQKQSVSADVQLNVDSAKATLADLNKKLDTMIDNQRMQWEKMTSEALSKQERFYKAIGDKENERRAQLTRFKNEALAAIDQETKAKLASIDEQMRAGKLAHDVAEREKTSLTNKAVVERAQIERKTASSIAREGGIGGFIRNKTADIGAAIGGPIGGMVSGAGAILTNPWALGAMAVLEMLNTRADFAKTGAQLANAGMPLGSRTGAGLDFATNLFGMNAFGQLGQALSQTEQRAIIEQMAGSRTMVGQATAPGGFKAIRDNLGLFANILPDAAKEMELFVDATKNLGMSQKDITATFVTSRISARALNMTQMDVIKTQMDMAKALRNLTNDGAVASSLLYNISGYLTAIGASESEKQRIGVGIAQGAANMTLPQMAGMFAFTHGGKLPTPEAMFGTGAFGVANSRVGVLANPFNLMGEFLTKIGNQFKNNPTARMFAADQLRQQFFPNLRMQDTPQFFKLAEELMSGKRIPAAQIEKEFRGLEGKTPQAAMADGIQTLTQIVGPVQRLENVFTNFWTMVDAKINKIFQSLGKSVLPFRMEHWFSKENTIHKPDAAHPSKEHRK